MPPKPVTSASRRTKRMIASPTPSASADGSEGEEELDMDLESEEGEEEEEVVAKSKAKGKAKAIPAKQPVAKASEDVEMDDEDEDDELASDDELDVIDDFESEEDEEGEEEKEDDDEEYEEEEEDEPSVPTPKPAASSSRSTAAAASSLVTPAPPNRVSRTSAAGPAKTPTSSISGSGNKTGLRIKLNVTRPSPLGKGMIAAPPAEAMGPRRPAREAAKNAGKKSKVVAMEAELGSDQDAAGSSEEDELDEEEGEEEQDAEGEEEMDIDMDLDAVEPDRRSEGQSSRAVSPTKLTARQRAKGNADLQGVLIELPSEGSGAKKLILTEAERVERREEMARRRKRQTDQRKQDEQDETINRLLRAQTSKSRNKIEAPETGSGDVTPGSDGRLGMDGEPINGHGRSRGRQGAVKEGMVRWVSTVAAPSADGAEGQVICRVGVPKGLMERTLLMNVVGGGGGVVESKKAVASCAVEGCENGRKYRSTRKFEVGGCNLEHLRLVNSTLDAAESR